MNADGSSPRRLLPAEESGDESSTPANIFGYPAWSPDGQHVIYLRSAPPPAESASLPAHDQPEVHLKPRSEDREMNGLWMVDLERSTPLLIAECADPASQQPKWSPDGDALAFVCGADKSEEQNVMLVYPNGDGPYQLTSDPGSYYDISWAPDSMALIFMQKQGLMDRQLHLSVFEENGGFHVGSQTAIENPTWSPVAKLPVEK